jgi:hypothetical protein
MNLQRPPAQYDARSQAALQEEVERADRDNFKRGQDLLIVNGERVILKSPNGSAWALTVSNTGVLGTAAA